MSGSDMEQSDELMEEAEQPENEQPMSALHGQNLHGTPNYAGLPTQHATTTAQHDQPLTSTSAPVSSHLRTRPAFSVLHDGPITSEAVMGCWCPTMDLLALVTQDGQLSIHRLSWQKLWTASLDNPVTAMCWRPDGEACLGCEHAIQHVKILSTNPATVPFEHRRQLIRSQHS